MRSSNVYSNILCVENLHLVITHVLGKSVKICTYSHVVKLCTGHEMPIRIGTYVMYWCISVKLCTGHDIPIHRYLSICNVLICIFLYYIPRVYVLEFLELEDSILYVFRHMTKTHGLFTYVIKSLVLHCASTSTYVYNNCTYVIYSYCTLLYFLP